MVKYILVVALLTGCTIAVDTGIQEVIEKIIRYETEAQTNLDTLRLRIQSDATVLNFYSEDFDSRIRYLESGGSSFKVERAYTDNSSLAEIYEYVKNGELWWMDDISKVEEGILKNSLENNGVVLAAAYPIHDDTGMLVGYIAASWKEMPGIPESNIRNNITQTAREITRLNGLF